MGEAFFCKRGGDGKIALGSAAMLCVKLPAGSTCLCETGSETLRAENAPGLAAFALPAAGTWTVTIQNGAQEKSESVTLAAGDAKILTLTYTADRLALLSPEDGLANGLSLNGENVSLADNTLADAGSGFWLSPAVDLTDYTQLTVTGTCSYIQQYQSKLCVDQSPEKIIDYLETTAVSALWPNDTAGHTVTLDVSGLSGSYYIGAARCANRLELTEIVLSRGGSGT